MGWRKQYQYIYDVALSFAGEDREYARSLAKELINSGVSVFYDEYEKHNLWGADLPAILHEVYSKHSQYVIIFVSKHYARKEWTTKERIAAQERAIKEKEKEYILPIRIDNSSIPGLPETMGYTPIDIGISEICKNFLKKIGRNRPLTEPQNKYCEREAYSHKNSGNYHLSKELIEDLWQNLYSFLENKLDDDFTIVFPKIGKNNIFVTPKLDYTYEDIHMESLIDCLIEPHSLKKTQEGYILEHNSMAALFIEAILDNSGLVKKVKQSYSGGA